MLRIDQLRLTPDQDESVLWGKIAKLLRVNAGDILRTEVLRRAVDAREELFFVYTVAAEVKNEAQVLRRCRDKRLSRYTPEVYRLPSPRSSPDMPPVVVGAGHAGLFAALVLANAGLRPILIERGQPTSPTSSSVRAAPEPFPTAS